ncbi:GH3 auxin-responsive promoter [bacterium]|nr:GH3 auxin-responsive promoter [bacterium]
MSLMQSVSGAPLTRALVNRSFSLWSRQRMSALAWADVVDTQRKTIRWLVKTAADTRFGQDHQFRSIRKVEDFQSAVPVRTYEQFYDEYLKASMPRAENLSWPGVVPFYALTSGTTQGATKYIPVTRKMVWSNLVASRTMVAQHMAARRDSKLFHGKFFFLGGSTALEEIAPGVRQGDLSGIAALEVTDALRPYTFPPLGLALETDWEKKLAAFAERSVREPITLISGVPSWLLILFERIFEYTGKSTLAEVWPTLEMVVHGGVKFEPYRSRFEAILGDRSRIRLQETYPCSEGFIAIEDYATPHLRLLFDHGIFYEFIPVDELGSARPTRHWLGTVRPGINYAIVVSTCAGMWAHLIGDTVRFESVNPPLLTFTGRTKYTLSAFGEHLISEEIENALATVAAAQNATVSEWHVGTVFEGALGYHRYIVEFATPPADLKAFRDALDADLSARNADYQAHRAEGVGIPAPELIEAKPGTFREWMRSKGKLGGQHKVPRMDAAGKVTQEIVDFVASGGLLARRVGAGPGG